VERAFRALSERAAERTFHPR